MLTFILEHLGLLLGLGFVLVATAILPGRLRWYVLSAGLAVIAFRAYQLVSADKRLKKADEERKELQETLQGLNGQRGQLQSELLLLNNQLQAVKADQSTLVKRRSALKESGDDIALEKHRLDEKAALALQQDQQFIAKIDTRESALALLNEAEQAYNELARIAH